MLISRLSFEATLYPIFFFFLSFFLSSPEVFFNVKFCNFSGSQLIPTRSNSFQLVPTCPNSSQLVPNCPKLSQLVLLCQNSVISLVPNSSQLVPNCLNSSQFVPTCPNLSQLVPTRPNTSKHVQTCPNSSKLVQLFKTRPTFQNFWPISLPCHQFYYICLFSNVTILLTLPPPLADDVICGRPLTWKLLGESMRFDYQ